MLEVFSADEWLGEALALPAFRLADTWKGNAKALAAEMLGCARAGDAFFYAKVPTTEVDSCAALCRAGFSVVDTGITLSWAGGGDAAPPDVIVGSARAEQHEAVAAIAESCFRWSRFHLDPNISEVLANRIKRRWAESYCRGLRGSALYVGEIDGLSAGFLAVLESFVQERRVATIDLIGVAERHQGRGVGSALVRRFLDEWRGEVSDLRVGTQAANIGSLRFYERNGFRISASVFVLHAHYRKGTICS